MVSAVLIEGLHFAHINQLMIISLIVCLLVKEGSVDKDRAGV